MMTFIDLVTDTGELVRFECKDGDADQAWEAIESGMKTRGFFYTNRFQGACAIFLGMRLDRINMGRIVGTLL